MTHRRGEASPILVARRLVDKNQWKGVWSKWRKAAQSNLAGHPWERMTSSEIVDDLRGGPLEEPKRKKRA